MSTKNLLFVSETFMAKLVKEKPVALEHAETKWVAPQNLFTLNFAPADIPAVEKIAKK